MALTLDEWKKQQAKVVVKEKPVNTAFLQQAAVEAKLLTGHVAWDAYLSKLQVSVDTTKVELRAIYDRLELPPPLTDEQLRAHYLLIVVYAERLRVLQQVMSLPKELVTHATELGLIPDAH